MTIVQRVLIGHLCHYCRFRIYTDNYSGIQGIQRIETDYSMALISACIEAMGFRDTGEYLRTAWECLESNKKITYSHHICRAHAIRFIEDNIKKHYLQKEESMEIMRKWMHQFLGGTCLKDFFYSVRDAILICGRSFLGDEVQEALDSTAATPNLFDEDRPWEFMQECPNEKGLPLYLLSPFGNLAIQLCKKLKIKIPTELKSAQIYSSSEGTSEDSSEENSPRTKSRNPHHNPSFLLYLLRYIFPFGCMMNHSLITLIGGQISEDTNAASESWNAVSFYFLLSFFTNLDCVTQYQSLTIIEPNDLH